MPAVSPNRCPVPAARPRLCLLAPFLAGLLAGLATGCGSDGAPGVTVVDSAGIAVVTSSAADRPVAWSYAEELRVGGEDEGPASFYRLTPGLLGTDDEGRIHVLHGGAFQVVTFDRSGRFLWAAGREGGGPGELRMPAAMGVGSSGEVSVFDYGKGALVRWDAAGEPLPAMDFPHRPAFGVAKHHVLTGAGYVVATEGLSGEQRAQRLIAVAGGDTTLLGWAVQPNQGMVMFESCGGGISFPLLFTPSLVWDYRARTVAVAATDAYRIDLWRDGRIVRSVRRLIPVTQATRELAIAEAGEGLRIDFGRGPCVVPPDEYADARGWAETVPAIAAIRIGPAGGLWVQRHVPGDDRPPIDRFDADGAYIGTLPAGTVFPALLFPDGAVGLIERDELDVDRLVVYRPEVGG